MNYYFIKQRKRQNDDYCFISRPPREIYLLSSYIMDGTPAITEYLDTVQALMSGKRGPVEYLPLSILNHKGCLASADYFYVNPLGDYDCLDYGHSEIESFEDTKKVLRVKRYVLCPKKLEQVSDLFRIKEKPTTYVISQTHPGCLAGGATYQPGGAY